MFFIDTAKPNIAKAFNWTSDCGNPIKDAVMSRVPVTSEIIAAEIRSRSVIFLPTVFRFPFPSKYPPIPKNGASRKTALFDVNIAQATMGPVALATLLEPIEKAV